MLDGAAKLPEVTAAAAAQGMPALAMTDHGNVFGAYDFYKQATSAGVKPIIGMEGYYTPGSRFDRAPFDFGDNLIDEEGDGGSNRGKAAYTHMTLLARTTEGMHNLFRISSLASLEGQYRKPRFDRDLLERYGTGLIATTGCPSGEVNMWLRAGKEDRARQAAADFQDIFGKENFYAELMDHGLSIEKKTKPGPAGHRQGPRHPAAGAPTTCTTRTRRTRRPTTRSCASRPARGSTRPTASASTATATT